MSGGKKKKKKSGRKIEEEKHPLRRTKTMSVVVRHPEGPRYLSGPDNIGRRI